MSDKTTGSGMSDNMSSDNAPPAQPPQTPAVPPRGPVAPKDPGQRYAQRVAEALERLGRLARAREFEAGLNPAQWEALRFIARANRFSNAPSALAVWLGSTKGTVSQTVTALERKGFVEKRSRPGPGRGVALHLTAEGEAMLKDNPMRAVEEATAEMGVASIPLARHLERLIEGVREGTGTPSFGTCKDCAWLRREDNDARSPLFCRRFDSPLVEDDLTRRCIEHRVNKTSEQAPPKS